MMLFLPLDVSNDFPSFGLTHGECTIAGLPMEAKKTPT